MGRADGELDILRHPSLAYRCPSGTWRKRDKSWAGSWTVSKPQPDTWGSCGFVSQGPLQGRTSTTGLSLSSLELCAESLSHIQVFHLLSLFPLPPPGGGGFSGGPWVLRGGRRLTVTLIGHCSLHSTDVGTGYRKALGDVLGVHLNVLPRGSPGDP